jgi:hypothetical protein
MTRAVPVIFLLALLLAWPVHGAADNPAQTAGSAALHARYTALHDRLAQNPFRMPLLLESSQASGDLRSDVYAQVDYAFPAVMHALTVAGPWCDVLILHLNVKQCRAPRTGHGDVLQVNVGRKVAQPLEATTRMDFAWRVATQAPDYFEVLLSADSGPFGTRNYLIRLEATPLEGGKTFIHLAYSYAYGLAARLALQGYLATFGGAKVGFSVVGHRAGGEPIYVGDVRGMLERNTMRYYLAVDAYLRALDAPPQKQLEARLHDWFAATERFPEQLHELSESEYLDIKRHEYRRQQEESRGF